MRPAYNKALLSEKIFRGAPIFPQSAAFKTFMPSAAADGIKCFNVISHKEINHGSNEESDLKCEYSWTAIPGDNPKVTGEPDSTRFSRNEGYEVIYLINELCDL